MTHTFNTTVSDTDVHTLLKQRGRVAVIWSIEDVRSLRPDLDDDQAMDVLEACIDQHDCEYGFTWTFIEDMSYALFPHQGAKS